MQHVEAEAPGPGPGPGAGAGLALVDPALVLAAATALALALYVWGMWRFDRFAARAIPFAPARPFVGAALPFLLRQRTFAQHLQALYRSGRARPLLGVFHLRAPAFLLREPRLVRRVLVADAAEFPRRCAPPPLPPRPLHPLLDKELDLLPGRRWRRVREVLGAALAPGRLEPQLPEVAACALRLAQRLELSCANGEAVEVRAPLEAFWSEALGRALLGRRSRALADARDALHRQRRALLAAPSPRALLLARCPALAQLLRIQPVPPSVEQYFLELADKTATDVIQSASTEKGDISECTESNSEELIKRTSALWYMISTYLFDADNRKQDVDKEARSRRDKTEAAQATTMQLSPEVANQAKNRPARKSVTFAPETELIVSKDATTPPTSPATAPNEHPSAQIPILNVPFSSANVTQVDVENLTSSTAAAIPGEENNTSKIETTPTQKANNLQATVPYTFIKEISVTNGDIVKSNVAVTKSNSQSRDLTIPVVVISAADVQETLVESTESVNSLHVKTENQEQTESGTSRVSCPTSNKSVSKEVIETITHSSSINHGNTPLPCPETAIEAGTTGLVQNTMILNNETDTSPASTMPANFTQKASLPLDDKGNINDGSTHDRNDASKIPEVSQSSELADCRNREKRDFLGSKNVEPALSDNLQTGSKETVGETSQLSQVSPESVLDSKEKPTTQEVCKVDQAPLTEQGREREKQERHEHLEVECENKASVDIPEKEKKAKGNMSDDSEKMTSQHSSTLKDPQIADASTEGEMLKGARASAAEAAAQLAAQAAEGGRRAALAVALALRLLGRHPEAQARAAAEAADAWGRLLGHDGAAPRTFTAEQLDAAAPYLDAVLAETLRLHPPCPLVTRGCRGRRGGGALRAQGAGLRVEVALGPRDALWVPVGAVQRDARHWRDADAFRPERFLGDARALYADHAVFLPFGLGPRACAGRELVLQYSKLALMAVLARVEVEGGSARGPREARWRVAMEVEGGVRLKLRPRAHAQPPHV